ncbi:hypothetical protein EVAR_91110_1 [Eumeta japonica]|uniref:Uncharacterized protein n=1 Tax=Eumeta variegata TaxID=151549 RepID=A0A4C1SS70_EUMVA|nr:hypothetical protein EVAR_91110_1 [Eumeta japonica]
MLMRRTITSRIGATSVTREVCRHFRGVPSPAVECCSEQAAYESRFPYQDCSLCRRRSDCSFGSRLTWKENIRARAAKAISAIYVCKRAIGRTWGLRPNGVLWLYEMVVKPILSMGLQYGKHWTPYLTDYCLKGRSHSSNTLRLMQKRRRLRHCLPLNWLPVDLTARQLARTALRLCATGMEPRPWGHASILENAGGNNSFGGGHHALLRTASLHAGGVLSFSRTSSAEMVTGAYVFYLEVLVARLDSREQGSYWDFLEYILGWLCLLSQDTALSGTTRDV